MTMFCIFLFVLKSGPQLLLTFSLWPILVQRFFSFKCNSRVYFSFLLLKDKWGFPALQDAQSSTSTLKIFFMVQQGQLIVCPLQSRHGPSACSEPLLLVMLLVHQSAAEKSEVLTYKVLHVKQSVQPLPVLFMSLCYAIISVLEKW